MNAGRRGGSGPGLHASLEYRTTLENLARVVVPAMADWCVVDLFEEDGSCDGSSSPTPTARWRSARRFRERHPSEDLPDGIAEVLRKGRARLWSTIDETMLPASQAARTSSRRCVGLSCDR